MAKYRVYARENSQVTFEVTADSVDDAKRKAENGVYDDKWVDEIYLDIEEVKKDDE